MAVNRFHSDKDAAIEASAAPIWRASTPRHEVTPPPRPTDPFDPLDLEGRLREARARRNAALARKDAPPDAAPAPSSPAQAEDRPAAAPPRVVHLHALQSPPPLVASPRPPRPPRRTRRAGGWLLASLFLAGLALGSVAMVTAPDDLRERAAALFARPAAAPKATIAEPVAPSQPLRVAMVPPAAEPAPQAPDLSRASRVAPAVPTAPEAFAPPGPIVAAAAAPPQELVVAAAPDASPGDILRVSSAVPAPAPVPAAKETAAPAPAAVEAASVQPATATEQAPLVATAGQRVLLHVPASVPDDIVRQATEALHDAGFPLVNAVPVNLSISRTNVRFYHDGDGSAANRVAAVLNASLDIEAPQARDFTGFSPLPQTGTLEVWFAGRGGAAAAPSRRAAAAAPAAGRTTPTASQLRAREAEAAEIQRLVDRSVTSRATVTRRLDPDPEPAHPLGRLGAEIDRAVDRFMTGKP